MTSWPLVGQGSEQVEALLTEAIPDARVARMDRDTIRRRGAHESLLRRFAAREIDVLVGTQMIAKGHDFHNVTLVGVLSADQSLGIPDFRAAERTFQLLTQVAGRAGRGDLPGRVLIQAFDPDHPVLRHAARQEFEPFYEREIEYRRALHYPPLTALARALVSDPDPFRAREWAAAFADAAREPGRSRHRRAGTDRGGAVEAEGTLPRAGSRPRRRPTQARRHPCSHTRRDRHRRPLESADVRRRSVLVALT